MQTIEHTVELVNLQHDDLTARILSVLGSSCVITDHYTKDDELVETEYVFPDMTDFLLVASTDSWGVVTGAWMHNGHLILSVNYGDDGNCHFSPTTTDDCVDREGCLLYTNRLTPDLIVRAVSL